MGSRASTLLDRLVSGEVHVYAAACPPEACSLAPQRALLAPAELARAGSFRRDRDRALFVAARALVRAALACYAPIGPERWIFGRGPGGRPEVAEPARWRRLRFSASHTDGLVACAVAWDRSVGVDVERPCRRGDAEGIARRFFAPLALAAFLAAPPAARASRFCRQWTLQEAYAKAVGLGLALPLGACAVLPEGPGGRPELRLAPAWLPGAARWAFVSLVGPGSAWLASAADEAGGRVRFGLRPPPPAAALAQVAFAPPAAARPTSA